MEDKIIEILKRLMTCAGVTNTEREVITETQMLDFFRQHPYFKKHPELCGQYSVPEDPLRRGTVWALVRTEDRQDCALDETEPTVVFMGHHDVVSAAVYGEAEPWAYDPDTITEHFNRKVLSPEAYTDLLSGEWIFGRGSCDMLGGTAVQMALLAERAEAALQGKTDGRGALLFFSVPDEESFSVGMRNSLALLEELKEKHHLEYRLAVCAEPNARLADGETQVIHSGSIGKLLPVVLVQGKLVQIGSYRDGVNPLAVLSRIVASTEGDETFTETCGSEVSVPPVWMYVRDLKEGYDFSLPRQAAGCCNILTFRKTPAQVMAYFLAKIRKAVESIPHPVAVMTWVTLWQQVKQREGFPEFLRKTEQKMQELLQEKHMTFPEVTVWMMQQALDYAVPDQPAVVLGFAPPYYPAVRSEDFRDAARFELYKEAVSKFGKFKINVYFTGVSDCSYCGLPIDLQSAAYPPNTPLWGTHYRFNAEALKRLQIPFFLLGPWGKDLHQIGERVNRYSLTVEYPSVLRKLLHSVWQS